jgi:hypothetical protein
MVILYIGTSNSTSRLARGLREFVAHAEGKTTIKPLAKIIQVKKKLNSPILIAGFPGAGLVGSISTSYIINRLHMNQLTVRDGVMYG